MSATDLMAHTHDKGFRNKIEFALFTVAKDKAAGATGDDLVFINAILVGDAKLDPVVTSVVVINATAATDTDAILESNVLTLWPFFARAWVARTV